MKITAVEAEVWRTPFTGEVRPAWSPGTVWREKSTTVFRVQTDAGLTGIGASQGSPQIVRDRIAPRLIGQDPFAIERLYRTVVNWGGGMAAISIACGIEMALWDLVGKAANLPLYKLWGAQQRSRPRLRQPRRAPLTRTTRRRCPPLPRHGLSRRSNSASTPRR